MELGKISTFGGIRYLIIILSILACTTIVAQDTYITEEDLYYAVEDKINPRGNYDGYVASNGQEFWVGDKITIGSPSAASHFVFIKTYIVLDSEMPPLEASRAGARVEIKKIKVVGNKRIGYSAIIFAKGVIAVQDLYIEVENALSSGEIVSTVMTSDEALQELKRAKDKLDLELITREEFEAIKKELAPLID